MTDQIVTVRVKSVSKSFGETRALRSVDFEARAGEVHAIVGENGSGKSTLAKIMSGVLLADQGDVTILGRAPRTPIQARDAGLAAGHDQQGRNIIYNCLTFFSARMVSVQFE